jgi:hypothetical protein
MHGIIHTSDIISMCLCVQAPQRTLKVVKAYRIFLYEHFIDLSIIMIRYSI